MSNETGKKEKNVIKNLRVTKLKLAFGKNFTTYFIIDVTECEIAMKKFHSYPPQKKKNDSNINTILFAMSFVVLSYNHLLCTEHLFIRRRRRRCFFFHSTCCTLIYGIAAAFAVNSENA